MAFRRWRQRETVNRHVLAGELEGNYIISSPHGSGVGSKLADFCNTASVGPRQYVLVRGSSEGWCRRSKSRMTRVRATRRSRTESIFSTVRLRTKPANRSGSTAAGLAMALELIEAAEGGVHPLV